MTLNFFVVSRGGNFISGGLELVLVGCLMLCKSALSDSLNLGIIILRFITFAEMCWNWGFSRLWYVCGNVSAARLRMCQTAKCRYPACALSGPQLMPEQTSIWGSQRGFLSMALTPGWCYCLELGCIHLTWCATRIVCVHRPTLTWSYICSVMEVGHFDSKYYAFNAILSLHILSDIVCCLITFLAFTENSFLL